MTDPALEIKRFDPVWDRIVSEAKSVLDVEPLLGAMIHSSILHHSSLDQAIAYRISLKLASAEMPEQMLREVTDQAYLEGQIGLQSRADLVANLERDPAC